VHFQCNWDNMSERSYRVTKTGLQLTALLLALGCCCIARNDLSLADLFRQFSSLSLLFSVLAGIYIELDS